MIGISDIYRALVDLVNAATTAADIYAPIVASDLTEPIQRPSIKIMIDDDQCERFTTHLNSRSASISIYYFPPNEHKWRESHFAMQDALRIFLSDHVMVNGFEIDIVDGITFSQTGGILVGEMSLAWYEDRPSHDIGDPMETLKINF